MRPYRIPVSYTHLDVYKRQEYDYISVLYPEGNMGDGTQFLFNHEDIDDIFFRGYEDEEREGFIDNLSKYYKEG